MKPPPPPAAKDRLPLVLCATGLPLLCSSSATSSAPFCAFFQLPYTEETDIAVTEIGVLRNNEDVGVLRDTYGADLVQLIGASYRDFCGYG